MYFVISWGRGYAIVADNFQKLIHYHRCGLTMMTMTGSSLNKKSDKSCNLKCVNSFKAGFIIHSNSFYTKEYNITDSPIDGDNNNSRREPLSQLSN